MLLLKHFPALQVLIPFFGGIFAVLFRGWAYYVATGCAILTLLLSSYVITTNLTEGFYAFGDWPAPVGIEYRLDYINQPVIGFLCAIFSFLLLFNRNLLQASVMQHIDAGKDYLFWSLLLFAQAGFLGMVSTNDLFNLYVFIEISSLSSYVLMAQGKDKRCVVGAFDYLILGTIGATLILIGIGFLLASTGSLNITDINKIQAAVGHSRSINAALSFIVIGCLLKVAFFPMHFWMVRSYSYASAALLTYLASGSSVIGIYVLYRVMYFVFDYQYVQDSIGILLNYGALIVILLSSFIALFSRDLRKVIIYSTASHIGYAVMLLAVGGKWDLIIKFLICDGINKIALFTIIGYLENYPKAALDNRAFKATAIFNIICSSGLPLGGLFLAKLQILRVLFVEVSLINFVIILAASGMSLLYHYKIVRAIFFADEDEVKIEQIDILFRPTGLVGVSALQVATLGLLTYF